MSSELAKKFRSLNIGLSLDDMKNTWDDFALVPIKRLVINPPEYKYVAVDIPSADGELDLSEALTTQPIYKNRTGSLAFRMYDNERSCTARYSDIINFIQGRRMYAILDEQPNYYYEGRLDVNAFEYLKGNWADISIHYNFYPYKFELVSSNEPWLWDPFNFETDVIRNYSRIEIAQRQTVKIIGSRKPIVPVFIVEGDAVNITFKGETYYVGLGEQAFANLILDEGENNLIIEPYQENTAYVTIKYRGASL